MKRLLAQIGITCFSALAIAFYLSEKATILLFSAAALSAILFLSIPKTRKTVWIPVVTITVALSCLVHIGFSFLTVIPVQERFAGEQRRVEAVLTDEVYRSYAKYYYRLETTAVDGTDLKTKLLLKTTQEIDIEPFDRIFFTADITKTENRYYLSKGYYLNVDTTGGEFTVTPPDNYPPYFYAIRLRLALREALDEYLPEDAASLCKAVLIGDKYALDTSIKNEFRYAGASYFVVVSGMHFSVVCLMLLRLLKALRLRPAVQFLIPLPVVLVYMAVTGFQPSVVRSGVMMLVYLIGSLARRVNDPHTSLGLSGIVCAVVFTPYGAGDIGLILSFAATFAIITWSEPIYRKIRCKKQMRMITPCLNSILSVLSASLAANIMVFPISVFVFSAFSTVTLFSALLLYLPVEILLILSLAVCLLFYLGPLRYLAMLISWPLYGVGKLILRIVHILSSFRFSYIYIGADYVYIWMWVTIALGVMVILLRKRYRLLPLASLLSAVLLLACMLVHTVISLNTVALHVFQCGDGIAAGLDYHGDLYMLGFSAKSKEAYRVLNAVSRRYGQTQLAVCMKKKDWKNYTRLDDREFAILRCMLYDSDKITNYGTEMVYADEKTVYRLGDEAQLRVCVSGSKMLVYLTVEGTSALLLPDGYPYEQIPEDMREADILVVEDSCEDYERLQYHKLVISSAADNADAVGERLCKDGCEVYKTCVGDVSITLR